MKNAAAPSPIPAFIGLAILLITAGCHGSSSSDESAQAAAAPPNLQAQMDKVRNDPNLPAPAKEAELRMLTSAQNGQLNSLPPAKQ